MPHLKRLLVTSALISLAACTKSVPEDVTGTDPAPKQADGVFDMVLQGKIYTGDPALPVAGEVYIEDGVIVDVKENASYDGENAIQLGDSVAFPGFVDGHAHLSGIGFRELTLNLEDVSSVSQLIEKVSAEISDEDAGGVLYGRGWIETGWPENRFPNRADLDAAAKGIDVAIILERADGHAVVVNSVAIKRAGIDKDTPNPSGGAIERDENGVATGMLIDNAFDLVSSLMDAPTVEKRREALQKGAEVYAAYGWTGMHNMSVRLDDADLMVELEASDDLPIRVYNAVNPDDQAALIKRGHQKSPGGRVETRAVKYYMDGALGSRGAALKEPYADKASSTGLMLISEAEAKKAWSEALAADLQIATHAIGDRGNQLVLTWFADVLNESGKDHRWRVEHSQIVDMQDLPMFASNDIIASMQPSHAIGDLHFAPDRLGLGRLNGAYAWRSLTDSGALIVGGSDAPVERGDPMIEFYATVARKDLKGFSSDGWHPEEALTREEALNIFTKNAAYAGFHEADRGVIKTGMLADISVFSADIMTIPEMDIPKTKAVLTIVDGEIAFDGR